MTGRGGRCKHQERQREREGPRRHAARPEALSETTPEQVTHAPLRFWFLRVSHLRLTPYESSQTLYLIIYSMPRDFLYRESTAFLCDFQALLKLNRVLKPGTRALWREFSHTAVSRVSRGSVATFPPIWTGDPRDFPPFDRPVRTANVTPVDSACASAW